MTDGRFSLAVSLLAGPPPMSRRVERAVAAGYRTLESWWPWATPVPSEDEVREFEACFVGDTAQLHLLNLAEGPHPMWGGRGLAGVPAAEEDFWENARVALSIADRLGVRIVNVLAGNAQQGDRAEGLSTLEERLVRLAELAARRGIVPVVEVLNRHDHPDYLIVEPDAVVELVSRVNGRSEGRVGVLLDTYHFARAGFDPVAFAARHADIIEHVQLADFPGRGEPGSGDVRIAESVQALERCGYRGRYGLEYLPADPDDPHLPEPKALWHALLAEAHDGQALSSRSASTVTAPVSSQVPAHSDRPSLG